MVGKISDRFQIDQQSDQGPHCLPFHLHLLEALLYI